ncbi:MAG TPA: hypothetical protein QF555_03630 [Candidatus Thalassarchaeaceae archaeon]|nr:hypothetical protein [Candidatus Thalassarchaeaceae archaeon]
MQPPNAAPSIPVGPSSAPASFDPIAEMEDKRNRKEKRELQLKNLKSSRTSKRMNVYFSLGVLTILFGFSFFPVSQGDISSNPHETLSAEEVTAWMDPISPQHWNQEQIDERAESKIWDGSDFNAGSFEQDLNLGIWQPFDLGPLNDVQVKLTLKGYRFDGMNTSFHVGLFESPSGCDSLPTTEIVWNRDDTSRVTIMDTPESLALAAGGITEVTLTVKPGRYCLIFQYLDAQDYNHASWASTQQYWKATVDSEADMFWPRAFLLPICVLILPFFIAAVIGAQKAGSAYKKVRYPEASTKSTEEQVMDAAEAERAMGMDLSSGSEGADEEQVDAHEPTSTEDETNPPEEEISSTETIEEQVQTESSESTEESADGASEYTDEQLLAAGWSAEQIAQMRGSP